MRSSAATNGVAMSRIALVASLALLATVGCGSEREFSGVWRQTTCGDAFASTDCDGFVYELHIGRYGDQVAGMVVRYVYDRSGFDNFQRPQECGCFFVEGGLASDDGLQFRLFDPKTPRYPQPDTLDSELGCGGASLLSTCADHRFILNGDNDVLEGVTDCADRDDPPLSPVFHVEQQVTFQRVVGQPRTECYARRGLDP